jgi:hypothetical protein
MLITSCSLRTQNYIYNNNIYDLRKGDIIEVHGEKRCIKYRSLNTTTGWDDEAKYTIYFSLKDC